MSLFLLKMIMFYHFYWQTLYDEAFISLYNVCYTSLPILALGIFDQVWIGILFKLLEPLLYSEVFKQLRSLKQYPEHRYSGG